MSRVQSLNSAPPLKPVHFHILMVLLAGPRHGYGIVKEIEETTGGRTRLEPGNLYRYLNQLRKGGLVEDSNDPPDLSDGDERRRYYRITPPGRTALASDVERMRSLVHRAESRLAVGAPVEAGPTS